MNAMFRNALLLAAGFGAGAAWSVAPPAAASADAATATPIEVRRLMVSLDEVKQSFVFGEEFTGRWTKDVVMSDGSTRRVVLTAMRRDGRDVVRIDDGDTHTFTGPNGTATNGRLMIQLRDAEAIRHELAKPRG